MACLNEGDVELCKTVPQLRMGIERGRAGRRRRGHGVDLVFETQVVLRCTVRSKHVLDQQVEHLVRRAEPEHAERRAEILESLSADGVGHSHVDRSPSAAAWIALEVKDRRGLFGMRAVSSKTCEGEPLICGVLGEISGCEGHGCSYSASSASASSAGGPWRRPSSPGTSNNNRSACRVKRIVP